MHELMYYLERQSRNVRACQENPEPWYRIKSYSVRYTASIKTLVGRDDIIEDNLKGSLYQSISWSIFSDLSLDGMKPVEEIST